MNEQRKPVNGFHECECPECDYKFKEYSRDIMSPSNIDCPECYHDSVNVIKSTPDLDNEE